MTKHTIEIDVPDGWEPCGQPLVGVLHPSPNDQVSFTLPVRPVWQWPEWLTAEWIVKSPYGWWLGTDTEPGDGNYNWLLKGVVTDLSLTSFQPPPCDEWRNSKRRNPRAKP